MKPWVPIAAAVIVVSALVGAALYFDSAVRIGQSPNLREPQRIAAGKSIYDRHCASCHGGNLEGQPNWTQPASQWPPAGAAA